MLLGDISSFSPCDQDIWSSPQHSEKPSCPRNVGVDLDAHTLARAVLIQPPSPFGHKAFRNVLSVACED